MVGPTAVGVEDASEAPSSNGSNAMMWSRIAFTPPVADLYGFDIALIDGLDMAAVAATADERVLLNRFRAASEDERRAALAAVCP